MSKFDPLSKIVRYVGTEEFRVELLDFINQEVELDHVTVVWMGSYGTKTSLLFTHGRTMSHSEAEEIARNYADRFLDDPNYINTISATARQDGALLPFQQDKVGDPTYSQYFYQQVGVVDKVSTVTHLTDCKILSNFYRLGESPAFSMKDRRRLADMLPLVAALIGNHFLIWSGSRPPDLTSTRHNLSGAGVQDVDIIFDAGDDPLSGLSARERQICEGIIQGQTTQDLAKIYSISESSIITYRRRAYRKLGLGSSADLLRLLLKLDPVSPA